MIKTYATNESVKVPMIMNWLGHEGLEFLQTLTDNDQGKCQNRLRAIQGGSEKIQTSA